MPPVSLSFVIIVLCQVLLQSNASRRPNIILFIIDDLGWNDTGYQGADYATPTLDKLAREGIRLKQYYVQPLCSPSRSALLSGRYPYNLGLAAGVITNGHPYGLGLNEVTIAQHLKDGGYSTHAVGKWDLGMHKWEYTPTYRGFDTFYGYYNADEDYFTHECGPILARGIDFRNGTSPVTNESGTYSTTLFTKEIQKAIENRDADKKPFFIYGAYQSVHTPLEVPEHYLDKCSSIPYQNRRIFCGMMQALDEGIRNITILLEAKDYLDDTIIIVTTDNGGQTASGSSNWPLRGNKATVFEGGVRGFSFVWGTKLPKSRFDNNCLMHITDWYRTIIEGIAGLKLSAYATDGYNMWEAITQNRKSPRSEILLQLNPPLYSNPLRPFVGQAAIREGDWKLITGQPDCGVLLNIACPSGWVHLDGSIDEPPNNPSLTWLFNVIDDPHERNNLAEKYPNKVLQLKEKIEWYNSTHIVQRQPPFDPKSNPKFFGGIWTPWLD